MLIAAAFLQSTELGIIAAVAIVAHEIPQEVGDFLILLHSGYTRARALAMNLLSSLATMVGGVLGYYGLQVVAAWETTLLGIVAASMIYVAVADLIPGLHRRPELRDTASQALLIALGIGAIAAGPRAGRRTRSKRTIFQRLERSFDGRSLCGAKSPARCKPRGPRTPSSRRSPNRSNEVTQGWMRLAGRRAGWLTELQQQPRSAALQAAYLEKQARLWSALALRRARSRWRRRRPAIAASRPRSGATTPTTTTCKQSYLLAASYLEQLVESAALERSAKERARFAVRQWIDAMCPANFAATNPQALAQAHRKRAARA